MIKNTPQKQGFIAGIVELIFLLALVFLIRTFGFGLYHVPTGSMETTMLVGERFFADKFTYWFSKPKRGNIVAFNDPNFEYSSNPLMKLFQEYVWGPYNWTKRVIGIPGDIVEGKIESGKPVVYVNGTKLDEPYINKYPLMPILKTDPAVLRREIQKEVGGFLKDHQIDNEVIERAIGQKLAQHATYITYDPAFSYENQPFYRINPDRILKDDSGKPELLLPGTPLQSRYQALASSISKRRWNRSDQFYIELGPNEYWLMGDNRLGSYDCRAFGPVSGDHIHGKILFTIWSLDSFDSWWIIDLINHPIDFWSRMRWGRFFKWVM